MTSGGPYTTDGSICNHGMWIDYTGIPANNIIHVDVKISIVVIGNSVLVC